MTKKPLQDSYEFVFITAENKESITSALSALITKFNGKVLSKDSWGKKTFAYKIKGKNSGYYFLWTLALEKPAVSDFKNQLNLRDIVLRYLLLKKHE